jgi:predicted small secreted protein
MRFKQIIALIMIAAFAMQTLSHYVIITHYNISTETYAKNCINKAKPEMRCNGKCQMMKKLQNEEKKDQQDPDRKGENKLNVLSSKSFFTTVSFYKNFFIKIEYPTLMPPKETKRSFEIFHPPSC